jgi:hypothetical protein
MEEGGGAGEIAFELDGGGFATFAEEGGGGIGLGDEAGGALGDLVDEGAAGGAATAEEDEGGAAGVKPGALGIITVWPFVDRREDGGGLFSDLSDFSGFCSFQKSFFCCVPDFALFGGRLSGLLGSIGGGGGGTGPDGLPDVDTGDEGGAVEGVFGAFGIRRFGGGLSGGLSLGGSVSARRLSGSASSGMTPPPLASCSCAFCVRKRERNR